ncbi:MAG: anthranilate phosphoribosyltransferase [Chlamydiales bacterium]|jgi:anthranilate phosphoribosyltransferase
MELQDALRVVAKGETLTREQARAIFANALRPDTSPVVFGAFLTALAQRGETAEEITGAADALRASMTPFEATGMSDAIDTCGTGGDGLGTFNISTAAAIVACAAGARVVKHGNRNLSSRCGSADLLEAAGIPMGLGPEASARVFEEVGITFLFAPVFHPTMRFAAPVRAALGIRTVFNYLGPVCNPARVKRQLLGTSDPARLKDFARVLEQLGHQRAYVVHGAGGADELTLAGSNQVARVGDAPDECFEATALGLRSADVSELAGGGPSANLTLLFGLLGADAGALRDAVLLNSACALVVAGVAESAADGVERAREAIDSGAAFLKLDTWRKVASKLDGDGA